jgi:hypothetical protein
LPIGVGGKPLWSRVLYGVGFARSFLVSALVPGTSSPYRSVASIASGMSAASRL